MSDEEDDTNGDKPLLLRLAVAVAAEVIARFSFSRFDLFWDCAARSSAFSEDDEDEEEDDEDEDDDDDEEISPK